MNRTCDVSLGPNIWCITGAEHVPPRPNMRCIIGAEHVKYHWVRVLSLEITLLNVVCPLLGVLYEANKKGCGDVRLFVHLSVRDAVQESKQFVDCHQIRHWRILQNRLSFEFRANGLNDSSTLPIWVHFSAGDHMHWSLWATVTSTRWVQWLQRKSLYVFFIFPIYFTKRREKACARNVLSDCEFSDRAMHRKLSCTERRKWTSFCTFHKYCLILGEFYVRHLYLNFSLAVLGLFL